MKSKNKILIGTSNNSRLINISRIIHEIDPKLELLNPQILNIKTPIENGNSELENLNIKLNYYYKLTKIPTISFDDGLNLEIKKVNPQHLIRRSNNNQLENDQIDTFNYWKNITNKYKKINGKLIKTMGIKRSHFTIILRKEIEINMVSSNEYYEINKNPLNYFIKPKGFNDSISKFNNFEIDKFHNMVYKDFLIIATNYE